MAGYDYGNARLRAMKSRLLSPQELQGLAESGSLRELIARLAKTAYRKPVEAALAQSSEMACIDQALRTDMFEILGKIGSFYPEKAGESVQLVLRRYDIHNLRALLRGLSRNALPAEILETLVPAGTLKFDLLADLARAPDVRSLIDSLASLNLPFAWPLVRARIEHPGADTARLELALEQWYFREALAFLDKASRDGEVLAAAIRLDADLENLLAVLRFVQAARERKTAREWVEAGGPEQFLVGPGSLSFDLLVEAAGQESLAGMVEVLSGTAFAASLRAGLADYSRSGRASEFERRLRSYRLEWMAGQILRDPLGIGVVLGYLALKENEVNRIRWIARGIHLGLESRAIQAEMEAVA